jgi:hypothetical protein
MKKKPKKSCCWSLRARIIRRLQNLANALSRRGENAPDGAQAYKTDMAIRATMLRREAVEEVLRCRIR